MVGSLPVAHDTRAHEAIQLGGLLQLQQQPRTPTKCAPAPRGSPAISPPRPPVVDDEMADSEFHKALAVLQETRPRMGDSESASCWGGASLFVANDDDVMDEDSETDEFITASENGVEDEDSEEDEFAKQIREPKELVVYKIIKGVRCVGGLGSKPLSMGTLLDHVV